MAPLVDQWSRRPFPDWELDRIADWLWLVLNGDVAVERRRRVQGQLWERVAERAAAEAGVRHPGVLGA